MIEFRLITDHMHYHEVYGRRHGIVFVCPECGDIWAKCVIPKSNWTTMLRVCETCPSNPYNWPSGSLLLDWDPEFNAALPPGIVEREFKLHLDAAEKELYGTVDRNQGTT